MIDYQAMTERHLCEPPSRPAHDDPPPHTLALALQRTRGASGMSRLLRRLNQHPTQEN
ncbi:hypothetical protein [Corynebacterium hindlerae]|uniref:hypothetical protein n=1 Tax=Corynebacterium hindlerae TaxID=699041 RepID=UPI003AAD38F0